MSQHYLVPEQLHGHKKDIEHLIPAKAVEDAEDSFVDAKDRLLDVGNWSKYSNLTNVLFHLNDSHGKPVNRPARKGDHIAIDITGRGSNIDWVTIHAIEYDDYPDIGGETFGLRLYACTSPQQLHDAGCDTIASGTFVIERVGKRLAVTYHSRNNSDGAIALPLLTDEQWTALAGGIGGVYNNA